MLISSSRIPRFRIRSYSTLMALQEPLFKARCIWLHVLNYTLCKVIVHLNVHACQDVNLLLYIFWYSVVNISRYSWAINALTGILTRNKNGEFGEKESIVSVPFRTITINTCTKRDVQYVHTHEAVSQRNVTAACRGKAMKELCMEWLLR